MNEHMDACCFLCQGSSGSKKQDQVRGDVDLQLADLLLAVGFHSITISLFITWSSVGLFK